MNEWIEKLRRPLGVFGVTLAGILFVWMSLNNFISHSEFWSINSGKLFGDTSFNALVVYYKSLFYLFLKIPFFLPLNNPDHILLVRGFFGLLATFYFYLIGLFVFRSTRSEVQTVLFLIFLLTFHSFTYNIFRVRADLLSHIFIFLALLHTQSLKKVDSVKFRFDIKTGLLVFLALLSTPKAIYSLITLIFYISLKARKEKFLQNLMWNFIAYLVTPFFVILFFASIALWTSLFEENPYSFAGLYFLENASQLLNPDFIVGFFQSLKINFLHYLAIALGLLLFLKNQKNRTRDFSLMGPALVTWILFLCYPEKWDYYLAVLLPLLSLPVLELIELRPNNKVLIFACLGLFITPFYMTFFTSWHFSNRPQLEAVENLERLLEKNPEALYYDSTGLLPRKKSLMSFVSFNDSSSITNAIEHIQREKPEIIFYTSKIHLQREQLAPVFTNSYSAFSRNLLIHKDYLEKFNSEGWEEPTSSFSFIFIYDFRPKIRFFSSQN